MPGVLLRVVTKQSGLSRGAILVFAVGVGLAATVFGLADPYVSRSLPYADPDRLVSISFDLETRRYKPIRVTFLPCPCGKREQTCSKGWQRSQILAG